MALAALGSGLEQTGIPMVQRDGLVPLPDNTPTRRDGHFPQPAAILEQLRSLCQGNGICVIEGNGQQMYALKELNNET
jgi:hypothetical protein